MKKTIWYLFMIIFIIGCQSVDDGQTPKINDFSIDQDISKIDVHNWETDEYLYEITDIDFIQQLISELSNSDNVSTANMDFNTPDYKVILISGSEVVYELGYYRDTINLGVIGRYWDFQKDGLYGVTLKLPIE